MNIEDVLREMRQRIDDECDPGIENVKTWAEAIEAIEAAMREPVAWRFNLEGSPMVTLAALDYCALMDRHDEQHNEIERLNYRLSTLEEDRLEGGAEIRRLRRALEKEAECIGGDLTSWRGASPKRIAVIKDLEWRREFIRAALNTEAHKT